jgi:hypothetical protein
MRKATTKEEMALLKEAGEMFNETGCVPGNDVPTPSPLSSAPGKDAPLPQFDYVVVTCTDPRSV